MEMEGSGSICTRAGSSLGVEAVVRYESLAYMAESNIDRRLRPSGVYTDSIRWPYLTFYATHGRYTCIGTIES